MLKRLGFAFLYHLSIRTKIIGLVIFLLLIAGTIGGVGATRMRWVGQQLAVLVEISDNMGGINQGVDRVARSTDAIQREVARLGELSNHLQAAMSRFRAA